MATNLSRNGFLRWLGFADPESVDLGSDEFHDNLESRIPVCQNPILNDDQDDELEEGLENLAQQVSDQIAEEARGNDEFPIELPKEKTQEKEAEGEKKTECRYLHQMSSDELDEELAEVGGSIAEEYSDWLQSNTQIAIDVMVSNSCIADYHVVALAVYDLIESKKELAIKLHLFFSYLRVDHGDIHDWFIDFSKESFYKALQEKNRELDLDEEYDKLKRSASYQISVEKLGLERFTIGEFDQYFLDVKDKDLLTDAIEFFFTRLRPLVFDDIKDLLVALLATQELICQHPIQ